MSWTNEIYDVYELALNAVGGKAILPISHSTQNAQIELTITESGDFVTADKIDKADAETIIPVTEDSGARSSGITPMPFADKLIYIAGDYSEYVTGKRADNSEYFNAYMTQLGEWAESEYTHKAVKAVNAYLSKCELMKDLIGRGVLLLDEERGKLADKTKIAGIAQEDSFVRFRIQYSFGSDYETDTWKDKSLYDSFIRFNSNQMGNIHLCYATGEELPATYKHPSKIRNSGDKAKLISSNDESGFTYRGRFAGKEEAISVSYEFSQKFHNALKWLITKQGISIDSMNLVVWASENKPLPSVINEFNPYADEEDDDDFEQYNSVEVYRERLQKFIFGYKKELTDDKNTKAMIMGLDAATTGRLSIATYAEISASDYIKNIEKWHNETAWHRFRKVNDKYQNVVSSFSLKEIANCAFGTEQGNFIECKKEVLRETILRLLPCVTEGKKLPKDIMYALFIKASNPLSYEWYNFQKVLETACGMIKKYMIDHNYNKGSDFMAYDPNITDRSYLFGCLLAIADKTEEIALSKTGEKRATNAIRLWSAFASRPYKTWRILEERINPYIKKEDKLRIYFQKNVNAIINKMNAEDFTSTKRLEPMYLLGYHNFKGLKSENNKTEE